MKKKADRLILLLFLALSPFSLKAQASEVFTSTITFRVSTRFDIPQSVQLQEFPEFTNLRFEQISGMDTLVIPFQVNHSEKPELCWIVQGPVTEGETRTFRLVSCSKPLNLQSVAGVITTDSTFMMMVQNKPVLSYFYKTMQAPTGISPNYARSGFVHPLWSPSGMVLTWIQAPDHYHHYGLWNPFTRATWKGITTDFWNLNEKQGTVKYKGIDSKLNGPVCSEIVVEQQQIAFQMSDKSDLEVKNQDTDYTEQPVLNELLRVRVWNVSGGFLVDYESELSVAIDEPVTLDAYRYGGGIGFRATSEWTEKNSDVITSEGKTWDDGDATRAKWCRVYGTVDGVTTGVLFLSSPDNYDFPQPMRIWPKKLVGETSYHFFEFTPIRENAWVLEPGKSYTQKYRIWVSEGEMTMDEMEAMWEAYER